MHSVARSSLYVMLGQMDIYRLLPRFLLATGRRIQMRLHAGQVSPRLIIKIRTDYRGQSRLGGTCTAAARVTETPGGQSANLTRRIH